MPKLIRHLVLFGLAALPFATFGDDTDIYIDNDPPPNSMPLVMFSLDYRANLTSKLCNDASSTTCLQANYFRDPNGGNLAADVTALGSGPFYFFDMLRLSLKVALTRPEFIGQLKVGFMMSHNQSNQCAAGFSSSPTCSDGGAILRGFQEIVASDTNGSVSGLASILSKLREIKAGPNSADHPYQGAELFFEYYRYITGRSILNGHNGVHDFEQGNSINSANMTAYAPASWDTSIQNATNDAYVSPLSGTECTKLYTVNFFFGNSQNDTDHRNTMNAAISAGGLDKNNTDPIRNNSAFPDIVGYLKANDLGATPYLGSDIAGDQSVTSYFFYDGNLQNNVDELAARGGTERGILIGTDARALVDRLVATFREILSTSSTFVAASVPVNVFNRASAVDNVYIAIFQADKDGKPFWPGNLKKLKIGGSTDDPKLVDALGNEAVGTDGRIRASSLTFWTQNNPASLLPADTAVPPDNDAGRDGKKVTLGGAGQKIPGFIPDANGATNPGVSNSDGRRQLYYLDTSDNQLKDLNATTATATALRTALKAADDTEALDLLYYIRGWNAARTGVRSWIMGDPLHSRPRPINYGAWSGHTATNPAIFIAVGSNDGFMRFIRNTESNGSESGREVWAFMPPEAMASLQPSPNDYATQKILRANTASSNPRHPIAVDGAPVELIIDRDNDGTVEPADGDKVLLFFGLRRGGRSYYALDVTNPTQKPTLAWRITPSGDFTELGLSFSTPRVGKLKVGSDVVNALFFAGGYDRNKDQHALGTDDSIGNAIYIVNAETGALIWKTIKGSYGRSTDGKVFRHPDLLDSIPSDLTIADTDADGYIDRILVGDTGGNVWRADVQPNASGTGDRSNWTLTLLAKLGRHATSDRANDRRFFHEPDLVQTQAGGTAFDAVLIGAGDRENPLDKPGTSADIVSNYFYMIRDNAVTPGTAKDHRADTSVTVRTHADITDLSSSNCAVAGTTGCSASDLTNGWKIELPESREKSLAAPVTFSNTVFFTSYVPKDRNVNTCAPNEGNGKLYAVSLQNASPIFPNYDNDSASLSLDDRAVALKSPGIPAQVVFIPGYGERSILRPDLTFGEAPGSNRYRTFWQRVDE